MKHRVAIGPSSFAAEDPWPLQLLQSAGCEVAPNPFKRRLTEEEIIEHLDGAVGLIAGLEPLNARVFESAANLQAIARVGIGMTNVDLDAAEARGIKVSNTPDGPVEAVAEMTLATMLSLCRRVPEQNTALHKREWKKLIGNGLRGCVVLLIGYGRIGRRLRQLLDVFGAKVLVYDPHLPEDMDLSDVERVRTLSEALGRAEIITLHAAGDEVILDEEAFGHVREGAILLNSARGELVDEAALVQALDRGTIAGAWFDAFWEEPYSGPLIAYPQVLLTPHASTYTKQCRSSMEEAAVKNLLRDLGLRPGE